MIQHVVLYYNTIKFLTPIQVAYRIRHAIKRILYKSFSRYLRWRYDKIVTKAGRLETSALDIEASSFLFATDKKQHLYIVEKEQLVYQFQLRNRKVTFEGEIDWHTDALDRLRRFDLHSFGYLMPFIQSRVGLLDGTETVHYNIPTVSDKTRATYEMFKRLISHWIEHNPLGHGDGWDAYPVSERIVNWVKAFCAFENSIRIDEDFQQVFLKSLFKQALFLERNLEYHIGGNHLIKNAKALVATGLFFRNAMAKSWLRKGMLVLWKELREQILADGGHYERSPMYHILVLQDYLECVIFLNKAGIAVPDWVKATLERSINFLENILHPDGEIPLFNDSAFGIAGNPQVILSAGRKILADLHKEEAPQAVKRVTSDDHSPLHHSPLTTLFASGYFVMRDAENQRFMIIDGGKLCPDHLPPHAHSDLLSYELSLGEHRMIVDSGVSEYQAGQWRQYSRSTRAHNTLMVDKVEQAEAWGSFRLGRRAYPIEVNWIETDDVVLFEGAHDGYAQMGIIPKRRVFFIQQDFWLVFDEIEGSGEHLVESFIHFHPEVEVRLPEQNSSYPITIWRGDKLLTIYPFGVSEIELQMGEEKSAIQGWYLPEFGKRMRNHVLILKRYGELPVIFGYLIIPRNVEQISIDYQFQNSSLFITVNLDKEKYQLKLIGKNISLHKRNGSI